LFKKKKGEGIRLEGGGTCKLMVTMAGTTYWGHLALGLIIRVFLGVRDQKKNFGGKSERQRKPTCGCEGEVKWITSVSLIDSIVPVRGSWKGG